MRKIAAIFLALSIFLLTGCQSEELMFFSVITAIGVDYKEDEYELFLGSSIPITQDGGLSREMDVIDCTGNTITQALADAQKKNGQKPYLRHATLFLLSEGVATESLENLLNYAINEYPVRLNARVLMTKDEVSKFFEEDGHHKNRILNAAFLEYSSTTTVNMPLNRFLYNVYSPGIDGFMPMSGVEKHEGLAIFSGFHYAGELSGELTPAFLMMRNLTDGGEYTTTIDGEYHSFGLLSNKGSVKAKIDENGQVKIIVEINATFRAKERVKEDLSIYEAAIESQLKREVEQVFDTFKEYKSDTAGVGEYIYRHDNKKWQEIEDDWMEYYQNSTYDITINASIDSRGKALGGE